ncbi:MAG: magnesium transporter [Ruminococcaceae bacterium]|nr:magnesium transporter [Oscillospiraceae bacterium]
MEEKDFEALQDLLENNRFNVLHAVLKEMNSVDIADFLDGIDDKFLVATFRILPKDVSAEVFSYMDTDSQEHIVRSITDSELHRLVEDMYIDDTVDFLEDVPANVVTRVLKATDAKTRETINRFLNYAEDTAGSIMTTEMVQLHTYLNAEQAIEQIRKTGVDKETIYTCYCIDDKRHLVGILDLKDLLLCEPKTLLSEIMDDEKQIISVKTSDDQEAVADLARKYDLLSVPVTDKENRLVGIITIDDIVDIIEEENTEDFEKMALLNPSDDTYLKTGVFRMSKNRIIWLVILMVSATLTGQIISRKQALLADFAFLISAMPMLMGTGGNAGSQVSTLIIRGLALGEIKIRDYFRVVFKELRVAFCCATVLAVLNFLRLLIVGGGDIPQYLIVSAAMFATVIIANIIGCTLPILARLVKLDPALMAGPLLSTIVDAATLSIYFAIAQFVLMR